MSECFYKNIWHCKCASNHACLNEFRLNKDLSLPIRSYYIRASICYSLRTKRTEFS